MVAGSSRSMYVAVFERTGWLAWSVVAYRTVLSCPGLPVPTQPSTHSNGHGRQFTPHQNINHTFPSTVVLVFCDVQSLLLPSIGRAMQGYHTPLHDTALPLGPSSSQTLYN